MTATKTYLTGLYKFPNLTSKLTCLSYEYQLCNCPKVNLRPLTRKQSDYPDVNVNYPHLFIKLKVHQEPCTKVFS